MNKSNFLTDDISTKDFVFTFFGAIGFFNEAATLEFSSILIYSISKGAFTFANFARNFALS